MSGSARLREVILVGALVPDNLLVVLERERGHVAGDRSLLSYRRRSDRLFLALNGIDEIPEMVDGAVALVEIGFAVEMHRLPGGYLGGRFAAEAFGREVKILPVHHLDGAFGAAELLAVAVMVVAKIAAIVDLQVAAVFIDRAEGIGH